MGAGDRRRDVRHAAGLAVLVFAVTLDGKLSGIVFALSFVVYFAVVPLIKKRASAAGY